MTGFAEFAPYLEDPLVLSGFALFLFFGALRFVVKRLPVVTRKVAGVAVLRLVTFGFVLALIVIVLGFGLRFMDLEAVKRAELAEQAVKAGTIRIAQLTQILEEEQQQSKELIRAINALAKEKGPDIDEALETLGNGDTTKAKAIFRRITEEQAPEIREAAAAYRHLGAIAFLDNTEEAIAAYSRAVELDPKNMEGQVQLGLLLRRVGRLDDAITAFRNVMEIADAGNHREWLGCGLGNLGIVYRIRGDLDQAEETHKKALAIYEVLGNKEGTAKPYNHLGTVYRIRGDLDRAEEMYRESLAASVALENKEGMANAYRNLGIVYRKRGDLDQAEEMLKQALALYEALGNKESMANAYINRGNLYYSRGDSDRAEEMYRESLAIHVALGSKEGIAKNYVNLGIVYKKRGDLDRAEEMYRESLAISEALGNKEVMAIAYRHLGNVLHTRGDFDGAKLAWKESVSLLKEMGSTTADGLKRWVDVLGQTSKK
jgi:tetratricopeptide (TPR) repeat protein